MKLLYNKKEMSSMTSLPTGTAASKANFDTLLEQLSKVQSSLDPLLQHDFQNIMGQLNDLEGAKLEVALAFTLATLFFVKANSQGITVATHPIHEELARIKSFVAQINQREKLLKGESAASVVASTTTAAAVETTTQRPEKSNKRLKVDQNAAKRIIKHNL